MAIIEELASIAASVVVVQGKFGTGAGVVIRNVARNSYVLTCCHIFKEEDTAAEIETVNEQGKKVRYKARFVAKHIEKDLVLLKTSRKLPTQAAEVAPCEPNPYERVYSVGCGLDIFRLGFEGIYIAKENGLYVFTSGVMPGQSGGALANSNGELIGIVSATAMSGVNPVFSVGYAVPLREIKTFIEENDERETKQRK